MKTIVFANHKGGCAKTTVALNVAGALASTGSRVLAVDPDQREWVNYIHPHGGQGAGSEE